MVGSMSLKLFLVKLLWQFIERDAHIIITKQGHLSSKSKYLSSIKLNCFRIVSLRSRLQWDEDGQVKFLEEGSK